MPRKYYAFFLLVILLVFLPCAAFAVGALSINGSTYNSTDLMGDLSGAGWAWQASANGGQGELTLNGYDGDAIATVDGVLNIHLIGENIITTNALNMLSVSGVNTGLNIYGSSSATDILITRSTFTTGVVLNTVNGINVTISNSATIPFTFSNISYQLDMSQISGIGISSTLEVLGINITQTIANASIVGIDMQMDNTVISMSNENINGKLTHGMWASPYYSSIQAEFNSCTFNISNFIIRGWYTGRDYASSSSATYNDCIFNMHTISSSAVGLYIGADNEHGSGVTKLILNNPSGEIDASYGTALYSRSSHPTIIINGATIQTWDKIGNEIENPRVISIFSDASMSTILAKSIGRADIVHLSYEYGLMADHIIFTPAPYTPPQTGDTSTPVLYGLLLLLSAAGVILIRIRTVQR